MSFHADELTAQARAGVATRSAGIRDSMLDQHRTFFAALPHLFVATIDAVGWPLATVLEGEPGFVSSPDPRTLTIHSLPGPDDPAHGTIRKGQQIGLLGIDLMTRRRNRANGVISDIDDAAFTVAVQQSFGNCPQYIQRRTLARAEAAKGIVRKFESLDDDARKLITRADTFFVASRSRSDVESDGGADISHRGGRPGFVRVEGDVLFIPDFRGNRYFNTLGNLLGEPRSSLLFLDFETGDVLQLQGVAAIDWSPSAAERFEGAERIWQFRIARGWFRPQAAALRGPLVDYSPVTLRTGAWPQLERRSKASLAGDSGLVSTADDYGAFARFMLSGATPSGRRLLKAETLKVMTANRLTPAQIAGGELILSRGCGWGLGLGVQVTANACGVPPGAYGWNGGFGTSWLNDPAKGLSGILLTQRVFDSPDLPAVHKTFWRDVYATVA
jgi:uncharacterized protein